MIESFRYWDWTIPIGAGFCSATRCFDYMSFIRIQVFNMECHLFVCCRPCIATHEKFFQNSVNSQSDTTLNFGVHIPWQMILSHLKIYRIPLPGTEKCSCRILVHLQEIAKLFENYTLLNNETKLFLSGITNWVLPCFHILPPYLHNRKQTTVDGRNPANHHAWNPANNRIFTISTGDPRISSSHDPPNPPLHPCLSLPRSPSNHGHYFVVPAVKHETPGIQSSGGFLLATLEGIPPKQLVAKSKGISPQNVIKIQQTSEFEKKRL